MDRGSVVSVVSRAAAITKESINILSFFLHHIAKKLPPSLSLSTTSPSPYQCQDKRSFNHFGLEFSTNGTNQNGREYY